MKANHILILILLFTWGTSFSQPNLEKAIYDYITLSVKKKPVVVQVNEILASDQLSVVYALSRYFNDSVPEVRTEAYSLLNIAGNKCKQKEVRIKIVKQIIAGLRDKDSGISGLNMNNLALYFKEDFDREAINELSTLLKEQTPNYHMLVELLGFVGGDEQKETISKMLKENNYPNNRARLAMHLALARLGDDVEVDFLLRKVKSVPVNDDLVYEVFPDLIYTSQKKIYDYLLDVIMLNDKNCSSGNPNSNGKIICAYKVIEKIASRIKNFPVETDDYGDIKTKDYTAMLTKTREWIKMNKENYFIITDKF